PAVAAAALQLRAKPRMGEFTAAVLHECMAQVVGNASEIAAGSLADEHVHQVRVGLRRLRTALRELPGLSGARESFEPVLVRVFQGLGERRDRTHVLRTIAPQVEAAGGPPLRVPAHFHEGADAGELVRASDFQDALLALFDHAEEARRTRGEPVRRAMRPPLDKLQKQVTREGRRFTRLAQEEQHQVRKRLKRLRYLSEFVAPLFSKKSVQRYLAGVKPAQEALGLYNDEIIAQAIYEELEASDPGARFGALWLQSRRAGEAKSCRKSLRALESAQAFWEKR
ncbi:MAG TPA: CHAD domain-containing protein, partial [Ramlibacter sp.]|nr:CHAD domain-containing protein [Ramlibacter sp.]